MDEAYKMFIRTHFNIDRTQYNQQLFHRLKLYILNLRKLINTKTQHIFLLRCRQQDIIPNFINSKTTKCFKLHQSTYIYKSKIESLHRKLNQDLLNIEIKISLLKLNTFKNIHNELSSYILTTLTTVDKQQFFFYLSFYQRKHHLFKSETLNHKISNLLSKLKLPKFYVDNTCVHNLTNVNLPEQVHILLSFGPKFASPTPFNNLPTLNVIAEVEDIFAGYNNKIRIPEDRSHIAKTIHNHIKCKEQFTYINKFLLNAQFATKQFIKNNSNLYITNSDKSNKTVVIEKTEYDIKMRNLLADSTTYKQTPIDPTKKINNTHNRIINKLFLNKIIDSNTRKRLVNYNPITPRIYGLPKLHKEGIPLRPIVSTIGSSVYQLSKFLIQILKPLTNNSPYNVKNSFEFQNLISQIELKPDERICSFDVVALYTNIPVELAIKEVEERWAEIEIHTNFPKIEFINLLKFCVKENNFFKFNNVCFSQKRGLAMGNPLSPILADIVMNKLFHVGLNKLDQQPTLIKKYVDDVIIIATPEIIDNTYKQFQNFNKNIQFTREEENDNCLPFLEINLIRKNLKIVTDWYSKPSNSNRMLNFLSSHPKKMKINVAKSLVNKILNLSHPTFHNKNKQIITHILLKNNYPMSIIKSLIQQYKNPSQPAIHSPQQSSIIINNHSNTISTVFKSISYYKPLTDKIVKIVKRNNHHIKFANKINNKMQNQYSKLKDTIDKEQNENLIYSIPCSSCDKKYIGHTGRSLKQRIQEHKNDVKNFNRNTEKTAVVDHYFKTGHTFKYEETNIIGREPKLNKRLTLEAAHIWKNAENVVNFRRDMNNISSSYSSVICSIRNSN